MQRLTGVWLRTWLRLRQCRAPINGSQLAAMLGCRPTAMNNRLVALERMGLAVGVTHGRKRERLWTAVDLTPKRTKGGA